MATTRITELPTATVLTGAELVPIVQGEVTKKVTTADIAALGGGGVSTLPPQELTGSRYFNAATGLRAAAGHVPASVLHILYGVGGYGVSSVIKGTSVFSQAANEIYIKPLFVTKRTRLNSISATTYTTTITGKHFLGLFTSGADGGPATIVGTPIVIEAGVNGAINTDYTVIQPADLILEVGVYWQVICRTGNGVFVFNKALCPPFMVNGIIATALYIGASAANMVACEAGDLSTLLSISADTAADAQTARDFIHYNCTIL